MDDASIRQPGPVYGTRNNFVLGAVVLAGILYILDFALRFDGLNIAGIYRNIGFLMKVFQGLLGLGLFIGFTYFILSRGARDKSSLVIYLILGLVVSFIISIGGLNIAVILHLALPYFIITWTNPDVDLRTKAIYLLAGYFIDFFLFGILNMLLNNPLIGNRLVVPIWLLYTLYKANQLAESKPTKTVTSIMLIFIILVYTMSFVDGIRIINETKTLGSDQVRSWREFVGQSFSNIKKVFSEFGKSVGAGLNETKNMFRPCYWDGTCIDGEDSDIIRKRQMDLKVGFVDASRDEFEPGIPVVDQLEIKVTPPKGGSLPLKVSCYATEYGSDASDYKIEGFIKIGEDSLKDYVEYDVVATDYLTPRCQIDALDPGEYRLVFEIEYMYDSEITSTIYIMDKQKLLEEDINDPLAYLNENGYYPMPPESTDGPIDMDLEKSSGILTVEQGTVTERPFGITVMNKGEGIIKDMTRLSFIVPDGMDVGSCVGISLKPKVTQSGLSYFDVDFSGFDEDDKKERTYSCQMMLGPEDRDPVLITEKTVKGRVEYLYSIKRAKSITVLDEEAGMI